MSMSWETPPPTQRYAPVPGFTRPESMASLNSVGGNSNRPSSGSPGNGPVSGGEPAPLPGTPGTMDSRQYEYDPASLPPAHRASIYSEPFQPNNAPVSNPNPDTAPSATLLTGNNIASEQMSYGRHQGYANMDNSGGYPMQGYSSSQQPASGFSRGENIPADQLWAMEAGKERVRDYPAPEHGAQSSRKKKWLFWGLIAALAAIIIAVVVAVVVTQVNKKGSGSSGNKSSADGNSASLTDPNDPSNFPKNDKLHNVFWGMAYQPDGAIYPTCGALQANVTRDIQLLSQMTTRLRLYGANCNVTALVMQAIRDTKVNMKIYPAIYVDSNEQAFTDQLKAVTDAITTYGDEMIEGLAVGNEFLLNEVSSVNTGAAYQKAVDSLSTKIQTVNKTITGLNLKTHIPVGTGDAGSTMSVYLAEKIDFFMANVHPWFGALPIQQAADWTWQYFDENDVTYSRQSTNKPAMYIAETGWPTKSMWANTTQDGAGSPQGDASVANLQTFLDTYVCQANANNTKYFYFEPFDQPWKEIYGGVEPYWGIFDSERNMKDVKIPTC